MMAVFDRKKLAESLKSYRDKSNLTQKELSNRLGVNRSTIGVIESEAQSPSMDVLNKICELLGKNIDYFFTRENRDPIIMMMGKLVEDDKGTLIRVIERIKVRKKYISLNKRLGD